MTPMQRERIERNMEYHHNIAEHYKKVLEPEEGDEKAAEARETLSDQDVSDAEALIQMHGDAAKMLFDMLGELVEPRIIEAAQTRPVMRRIH